MNRDRCYGICKQVIGMAKEKWGRLVRDQFTVAAGTRDRIAGRVQERCGVLKEDANRQLVDFANRNRNWWDLTRR